MDFQEPSPLQVSTCIAIRTQQYKLWYNFKALRILYTLHFRINNNKKKKTNKIKYRYNAYLVQALFYGHVIEKKETVRIIIGIVEYGTIGRQQRSCVVLVFI